MIGTQIKWLKDGLSTIALGLLWIVGLPAILFGLGNSPITEFLILRNATTADGWIVKADEDVGDNGEGHAVFNYDLYYTYRLESGKLMHGEYHGDGRLDSRFASLTRPYPIKVEYVPSRPDLSRVRGSGCQTLREWAWRKLGIGIPLFVVVTLPGFALLRKGIGEIRNDCRNRPLPPN